MKEVLHRKRQIQIQRRGDRDTEGTWAKKTCTYLPYIYIKAPLPPFFLFRWRGPFLAEMEVFRRAIAWFGADFLPPDTVAVANSHVS